MSRNYAVRLALYDIERKRVAHTMTVFRSENVTRAAEYAQDINMLHTDRPALVEAAIQALLAVVPGARYTITASVGEE